MISYLPGIKTGKRMNRYLVSLLLFTLVLAPRAGSASQPPVVIDGGLTKTIIGKNLSYYADESGRLGIGDISADSFDSKFTANRASTIGLGYTRSAVWIKFSTENPSSNALPWYLEFSYAIADNLDLFVPEGKGFRAIRAGDHYPFSRRPVAYRSFIFPMTAPPGLQTCYLRVRSSGSITVPLAAWSIAHFGRVKDGELLLLGLYYGVMLALAFYHLFIYFSVRDRSYLYLMLFILGVSLFTLAHNGLAFQYLWPDRVWWANQCHPVFAALTIVCMLLFTRSFLYSESGPQYVDTILRFLIYLWIPITAVIFFTDYFYATQLSVVYAAVSGGFLFSIGTIDLVRGSREARFYMFACASLLTGVVAMPLMAYGFLPESFFTTYGVQTGSSLMALLLSLGVADKINKIREEREDAVEEMRESEERYRTLVENALDGIMLLVNEKPVYANPSLVRMLGYTREEFTSRLLNDFLADTDLGRQMYRYYNDRVAGRDVPTQYEAQLKDRKGAIIDVIISASRIPLEKETGVIAIITNVTHARRAETTILQQYQEIRSQYEELEAMNEELTQTHNEMLDVNDRLLKEKEQLTATLSSIEDAVITTDTCGEVIMMNSAAEDLTGWLQEEMTGRHVERALDLSDPSGGGRGAGAITGILLKGESFPGHLPLMLRRRDGTRRIVEINGAPVRARRDRVVGMVLAIRDITEKNKLEQEMLKVSKIESLGVLAGGIAHDFNNILTAIIGNLSIAKIQLQEKENCLETIDTIELAARRAVNLTRQLLTFSKGGEPVRRTASVIELLEESVNFILSGSNVKSEFYIQDGLWAVDIDADQISQVLNNIIINAMQAMPGGGNLSVSAANVSDPAGIPLARGKYIRISIADQGTGIPAENIDKIFDPYFTTKEHGSGIGLASSYSIVKKHKGYINAESQEGRGATFHIFLPASDGIKEMTGRAEIVRTAREGRILIMDDEEYILQVSRKILEYMGYVVESASDGAEAVEMYRTAQAGGSGFDAVIMDLTVPGGMGGFEALKKLKELDPGVVAVVSSGYYNDPVMANYCEYGFAGVITKPFEMNSMIRVLDEVLKHDAAAK